LRDKIVNRGETPCPHCKKGIKKNDGQVYKKCPYCGQGLEPVLRTEGRGAKVKRYIKPMEESRVTMFSSVPVIPSSS